MESNELDSYDLGWTPDNYRFQLDSQADLVCAWCCVLWMEASWDVTVESLLWSVLRGAKGKLFIVFG